MTDFELLVPLRDGDEQAFSEIYERYWRVLWQFAKRHLRDDEESKDVLQEVFSALWKNRSVLQIHTCLSSYLYRATLNRVLKRTDRAKVIAAYQEQLERRLKLEFSQTPEELFLLRELEDQVYSGMSELPIRMREVFEASRSEGLSYDEISKKLGVSKETVRSQIKNALKILRKRLNLLMFTFF